MSTEISRDGSRSLSPAAARVESAPEAHPAATPRSSVRAGSASSSPAMAIAVGMDRPALAGVRQHPGQLGHLVDERLPAALPGPAQVGAHGEQAEQAPDDAEQRREQRHEQRPSR